jgi:hypothetical protein
MSVVKIPKDLNAKVAKFAGHDVIIGRLTADEYDVCDKLAEGWEPPSWDSFFRRAGHLVECSFCGRTYIDHPHHFPVYTLHVLCNGDLVKL